MHIPLWILIWMPKDIKEKIVHRRWDKKSDDDIRAAYEDATWWIEISKGIFRSETTIGIAGDCQTRLDKYILPQISKRGLVI